MDTAIGVAIGLMVGVPLSLLGSYWLFQLQRQRKEISYEILLAGPIINPMLTDIDPIRVTVDSRFLGQPGIDFLPVSRVYSFRVTLRNQGNVAIENGAVFIRVGEGSHMVKVSVSPMDTKTTRQFQGNILSPRLASIDMPILNPKEELLVEMLSVHNESSECEVWTEQPNLECINFGELRERRASLRLILGLGIILAAYLLLFASSRFQRGSPAFIMTAPSSATVGGLYSPSLLRQAQDGV